MRILIVLCLGIFLVGCGRCDRYGAATAPKTTSPQEKPNKQHASLTSAQAAATYFEAVTTGDLDTANNIASAPFWLDEERVLKTMDEIADMHKEAIQNKGKRIVPIYTISTLTDFIRLPAEPFGNDYQVYRITLDEPAHKGKSIDIYVKDIETQPKVIGFVD